MNFTVRTDLACESMKKTPSDHFAGSYDEERIGCVSLCRLRVDCEAAACEIGRPMGEYITLDCGRLHCLEVDESDLVSRILSEELRTMAQRVSGRVADADFSVLVVGLGNAQLTADAIGPKTVGLLSATRHLRDFEDGLYRDLGCVSLSALAPGVLGQTGIEVLELLRGTVEHVRPHAVLAIDALAARSCGRLASTIQLSDAGIHPGSGVGNHRGAITKESLGVPVIALGVPTVVDSATLVYDALEQAGITEIDDALRGVLENGKSFFVSPKESDVITQRVSALLAQAIGLAFGGRLLSVLS